MSVWVCPHCPNSKAEQEIEKIDHLARLYAFPTKPEFKNGSFTILDSGAFGLSKSGKKMDEKYLFDLSEHYRKFEKQNVMCVAPDVALNPMGSIKNFKKWQSLNYFKNVVPVLQSDSKDNFNESLMLYQAEFYRQFSDKIFVGSPKASADFATGMRYDLFFEKLKKMGFKFIHKLGVGWNLKEISYWANVPFLDSFDSIAYYTSGREQRFGSKNPVENVKNILEECEKWKKKSLQ